MTETKCKSVEKKDPTKNFSNTEVVKYPQTRTSHHEDMIARAAYYMANKCILGLDMKNRIGPGRKEK